MKDEKHLRSRINSNLRAVMNTRNVSTEREEEIMQEAEDNLVSIVAEQVEKEGSE